MKTIVVLGMHRSSTSLVARTLNSEVHMGEKLLVGLSDNPKGHYENVKIISINDKILHQSGGSWHNPPPREKIIEVGQRFEEDIKEIISNEVRIAEEKGLESWGFKDPRTSLTIDVWYKYIPNPQFVVCYRKSEDVALSLQKRNKFSIEKGISLTKEYNKRISEFLEEFYG